MDNLHLPRAAAQASRPLHSVAAIPVAVVLCCAMLEFAREHGYLREGEPVKMRSKVATSK